MRHAMAGLNTVYVYSGDGAGTRSILSTIEALKSSLVSIKARTLGAEELLRATWRKDCKLLCFPGGADLPYCKALNGKGNSLIKDYVRDGGAYLGLCAGGYYACARIEFELGTKLEVKGPRELAFFPGVARGAFYPGFEYQTEAGSHAAPLQFKDASGWRQCRDYSNGGPAFSIEDESATNVEALAFYAERDHEAAAVRCQVGEGVAVLCGTHPELGPRWLDSACDAAAVRAAHPDLPSQEVDGVVEIAKEVRQSLAEDTAARTEFWKLLLRECGLQAHLNQTS